MVGMVTFERETSGISCPAGHKWVVGFLLWACLRCPGQAAAAVRCATAAGGLGGCQLCGTDALGYRNPIFCVSNGPKGELWALLWREYIAVPAYEGCLAEPVSPLHAQVSRWAELESAQLATDMDAVLPVDLSQKLCAPEARIAPCLPGLFSATV
eukprot:scaffold54293_cov20-Tisochrysis_lutea.AAC.2